SGVGEATQGAVTIQPVAANADAAGGGGRGGRGGRGGGAPGAPDAAAGGPPRAPGGGRMPNFLNALSMDGMFHSMYVSNGEEPQPPVPFLPANANAQQLTVVDNVAYAATTHGCGGAANGIWALDIASKKV